jgi:hypothetical protein
VKKEDDLEKRALTIESNENFIDPNLKNQLIRDYPDIFTYFDMDISKFLSFCQQALKNQSKLRKFDFPESAELVKNNINNDEERIYRNCIELLENNKNSSLLPNKRLFDDFDPQQDYVRKVVDCYLREEEDKATEILGELKAVKDKEEQESFIIYESIQNEDDEEDFGENIDSRIPWWLKFIEVFIIIFFVVISHLDINTVDIGELSYFNNKTLEVFQDYDECLNSLSAVQSPHTMNDWIYNCLNPTIDRYYYLNSAAALNNGYRVYIPYFEIQIDSENIRNCNHSELWNIKTFNSTGMEAKCFNGEKRKLKIIFKKVINYFFSEAEDRSNFFNKLFTNSYSFFDTLFYSAPKLTSYSSLIVSKKDRKIKDYQKWMSTAQSLACHKRSNVSCSSLLWEDSDKNTDKLDSLLDDSNVINGNFTIGLFDNNIELVDYSTKQMNINLYFISTDESMINLVNFYYAVDEASIRTGYKTFTSKTWAGKMISRESKFKFSDYYGYMLYIIIGLMFVIMYFKNSFLLDFSETINRSFFFNLFICIFIFECIFKIYHTTIATADCVFPEEYFMGEDRKFLALLFTNNIRILRAFSVLTISYHLIYVVFPVKELVVFTIFLKPVFQRFFIVVVLFLTSLAITMTVLLGTYYSEYSSLPASVLRVLNYAMGINFTSNTDESTFPSLIIQMNFYFKVFNFLSRLVVINFAMITMFYYFRKTLNYEKSRKKALEEKKKN